MPYISTERVKEIRNKLKKVFPKVKFSVRTVNYSLVHISIMKSPFTWSKDHLQLNHYCFEENVSFLDRVYAIANEGNYIVTNDSDYGNIPKFYVGIEIGKWDKPHEKI